MNKVDFLKIMMDSYSKLYQAHYQIDKDIVFAGILDKFLEFGIVSAKEYATLQNKFGKKLTKAQLAMKLRVPSAIPLTDLSLKEIDFPCANEIIKDKSIMTIATRCDSFFDSLPYDNYCEIQERIGKGNFSEVYKVFNHLDQKWYAVKIIEIKSVNDLKENRILSKLDHTNIVRYFTSWIAQRKPKAIDFSSAPPNVDANLSSGDSNDDAISVQKLYLCIQMEIYKHTVRDYIQNRTKINKSECWTVIKQILNGLLYMHANNVIHRDLKPDNIFLDENLNVKIGDFGLATFYESNEDVGSIYYISPEQRQGKSYSFSTDLFSLGLIIYQLLHPGFKTTMEQYKTFEYLRNQKIPEHNNLDEKETEIVTCCLSHDPEIRTGCIEKIMYLRNA